MAPRRKVQAKPKATSATKEELERNLASALRVNLRSDPYVKLMEKERSYVTSLLRENVRSWCGGSLVVNCSMGDHDTGARLVTSAVEETAKEMTNALICVTVDGRQTTSRIINDILSQICRQSALEKADDEPSADDVHLNKARVYIAETMKNAKRRKCYYVIVLEHFECFVTNHPQPLLYVLLDSTHNAPLFVIAVTESVDAVENLEKRVRSRLSCTNRLFVTSRHYCNSTEELAALLKSMLLVDGAKEWNVSVEETLADRRCHLKEKDGELGRTLYDIVLDSVSASQLMQLAQLCARCALQAAKNDVSAMKMNVNTIREAHAQMFACDSLWYTVRAVTPTELCLLLAARDTVQPKQNRVNAHNFTFDEVYRRFHAHLNKKGDRMIDCDKDAAFVAFERLRALRLIWPTSTRMTQQRNFRPYYLQPTTWNLKDSLNSIQEKMPALVMNWIKKSSDE